MALKATAIKENWQLNETTSVLYLDVIECQMLNKGQKFYCTNNNLIALIYTMNSYKSMREK